MSGNGIILTLSEYPSDTVRVACRKCGRVGLYRRSTLIARYGRHISLPDLQMRIIAHCPRIGLSGDYCGAYFVELAEGGPSV